MSEIHCNRVLNSSKTPRQFASNIILANFNDELLMTSTVTGYTIARRGKKKKCNKLDEKKLGANEDAYKHWINNVYKTKFADTPDKDNSMREMSKFYYYVGKKLADLKKICEDTDEDQSIDEGSEDVVDDSQMNDENARLKNSDKKKKYTNRKTRNSKITQETNEQSEKNANIVDEDVRFYNYSPQMF
ncbi:uncharacterized protein LOC120357236 [Solenopsis invicta]|uniref:uncharacterized protein LOC120357236 n=1 Tax=Solenopsis invicta TaxID=13686 RepID=UPI00193E7B7A|nr:uncharacterized protein LOC120357236 [Solenopsis invicta]